MGFVFSMEEIVLGPWIVILYGGPCHLKGKEVNLMGLKDMRFSFLSFVKYFY